MNKNLKIAVGIPTINRADLLKECLDDLAKNMPDIDCLILVDNGHQNIIIPAAFKKVFKHEVPTNLGVAGSWNFIMKTTFLDLKMDYLLILNDDIVLGRTKQDLYTLINKYPDTKILVGKEHWSAFLLHKDVIKDIGFFDEKFYPAYYEDNDYFYRGKLKKINIKIRLKSLTPKVIRNSQSIIKDPELEKGSPENHDYFRKKWGGDPHKELFKTPFNKPDENFIMNTDPLWKEPGVISLPTGHAVLRMKDGCDVWTSPTFKQYRLKDHKYDEILKEGVEILESLNIFCWLSAGTALGIYRENNLIKDDTDIDIGMFGKDYTLEIERLFFKNKFNLIRASDRFENPQQRAWQKNDVVFDIACYWRDGEDHYINYIDYGFLRKEKVLINKYKQIIYNGKTYNLPSPEAYCLWRYGVDWKTPSNKKGLWAKAMAVGK